MTRTIVMIHGAFAGGWCFESFAGVFASRGWTCHAPNLRFHGDGAVAAPDPRLAQTSISDYTRDMAEFISGLGERPIVIGHSMGGLIAQKLAAQGRVEAMVLLASGAPWGVLPSTDDELAIATGLMSAGPFWTRALTPVFEVAAKDSLASIAPAAQRSVFDRFGPESGRALFELFFWMFDKERATQVDAQRVTCPVLVVNGSQDKVVSAATGRQIARLYGERATFHEAPGHGHFLLLEEGWQQLARHSADWIAER